MTRPSRITISRVIAHWPLPITHWPLPIVHRHLASSAESSGQEDGECNVHVLFHV